MAKQSGFTSVSSHLPLQNEHETPTPTPGASVVVLFPFPVGVAIGSQVDYCHGHRRQIRGRPRHCGQNDRNPLHYAVAVRVNEMVVPA